MSEKAPTCDPAPAKPRRRRQDRRRRETEGRLLAAGLEELQDSATGELSIRAVAERAGISPANAYKYFPSKSTLVASIYLDLLQQAPLRTDVNHSAEARVTATMHDMVLLAANRPELARACAAALVANEPAVQPVREAIAAEVGHRIVSALGPGWHPDIVGTLLLSLAGALITARFQPFPRVISDLDRAVQLILGAR